MHGGMLRSAGLIARPTEHDAAKMDISNQITENLKTDPPSTWVIAMDSKTGLTNSTELTEDFPTVRSFVATLDDNARERHPLIYV